MTADNSIVPLLRDAMQPGASPEHLRELLAVRREWEADEARKAFNLAISEFQRRAPIIAKLDDAYGKKYAKRDRIWREIRPLLTKLGLSVTFQVCEVKGAICHIEGQLRHRAGHGERLVQDVPIPELLKGQNAAQQLGSADEYARRYCICSALGIVTGEDDDAHKAGGRFVTAEQAHEIADLLDACRGLPDFKEPVFWGWAGHVEHPAQIAADRHADVVTNLRNKLKKAGA
jgi:hypothetical protein